MTRRAEHSLVPPASAHWDWPPLICADCFHQQQHQPEIYCKHTRTRAWFDADANLWRMEWPVQPGRHDAA